LIISFYPLYLFQKIKINLINSQLMKQLIILIACVLLLSTTTYSTASNDKKAKTAQDPPYTLKGRNIFLELGGPSSLLSLNFDTRFKEERYVWGVRIGAGFLPDGTQRQFSVPAQLNYLFGKERHFFEAGAGATYFHTNIAGSTWGIDSDEGSSIFGTLSAGYRYQPITKGITLRAGATSLFGSFLPGIIPHISVGYAF
jgi:hypothetical protein